MNSVYIPPYFIADALLALSTNAMMPQEIRKNPWDADILGYRLESIAVFIIVRFSQAISLNRFPLAGALMSTDRFRVGNRRLAGERLLEDVQPNKTQTPPVGSGRSRPGRTQRRTEHFGEKVMIKCAVLTPSSSVRRLQRPDSAFSE